MSRMALNRKKLRLQRVFGLRARLAVLALILVGPLMIDRIRVLETIRTKEIDRTSSEFAQLTLHSIDSQRDVFLSVEAVLKSSASIYASANANQRCAIMRASLRSDLPWIRSLSIVGEDGLVQCSTSSGLVGQDLSDRVYVKDALRTQDFVVSDYEYVETVGKPSVMAAYPVPISNGGEDAVIVGTVDLGWMKHMMSSLGGQPGLSAFLLDRTGRILATPPNQASTIGHLLTIPEILSAVAEHPMTSRNLPGRTSFIDRDGNRNDVTFASIPGTGAQLVISIDVARVSAETVSEIRTAYLQLALVCLFVLLGALAVAERIVIRPITVMTDIARRFGRGDRSARAGRHGLPAEFVPLARAFNEMAAQLGQRERDMVAANDRLTVMASIDVLTGLANRRGFQNRLDFEWMKAMQTGDDLALVMIDVDHFKAFNDNYGHPEGDACLARFGETLGGIAYQAMGFAARYGGEEFCLLLPGADSYLATEVGELIRTAIQELAIPHASVATQRVTTSIGLASTVPNDSLTPKDLVEAADAALYAAKHRGRNNVVCHGFKRPGDSPLALVG